MIREGSAAKNFEALHPLIRLYPQQIMFCTDDAHPDEIKEKGHIDRIVRMSIAKGYDLFDVLKAASVNTIKHYHLSIGSLKEKDTADFVIVKDLKNFQIIATYINGIEKYNFKNSELKETEKGVEQMCREMEEIRHEGVEEGRLEGIETGISVGRLAEKKETAISLAKDGMSVAKIAQILKVDIQTAQEWILKASK